MNPSFAIGLKPELQRFLLEKPHFERFRHVVDSLDYCLFLHNPQKDFLFEVRSVPSDLALAFPKAKYVFLVGPGFDKVNIYVQRFHFFNQCSRIPLSADGSLLSWDIEAMYAAMDFRDQEQIERKR